MFLQAVLLLLITGLLADGASIPTPLHKPLHKRRFLTQQIYEEVVAQGARPQDTQMYIIKLKHHGHATYDGSLEGYQATGPQFTNQKLQMDSEHYQMYDSHLSAERDAAKIEIAKIIGHPVDILFEYTVAFHGMAVSLTVSEAQAVATKLQDLVHIQVDRHHEKSSFTAGNFVGTATIWGGSAGLPAAKGEGMKAAIFDDALNPFHDSFADQGIVNPLGAGTYLGVCNPSSVLYNATSGCNSKVIGMYSFSKDRTVYPVMHDGQQEWHGTHVASIAVGQMVQLNTTSNYYRKCMTAGSWGGTCMCPDGAVYAVADNLDECASLACEGGIPSKCERMNRPERLNMKVTCDVNMGGNITASGMAPHANLIFYEVCDEKCMTSYILAAQDQAIKDGVDVINLSMEPLISDPLKDMLALGWLSVQEAGIFYTTAFGAMGAAVPWTTTVAAVTHDHMMGRELQLMYPNTTFVGMSSGPAMPMPAPLAMGGALAPAVGYSMADAAMCKPGAFGVPIEGHVILCEVSDVPMQDVLEYVYAGKGRGVIFASAMSGPSPLLDGLRYTIPALHINRTTYELLNASNLTNATLAYITGKYVGTASVADQVPSGRPVGMLTSMPSLAAPGVTIFAASVAGTSAGAVHSGSSMASAVVAGAALLLKQQHPSWTPAMLQSAMMLASRPSPDPLHTGSGILDVAQATGSSLVLDAAGTYRVPRDPATLNTAMVAAMVATNVTLHIRRRVTSTLATRNLWNVSVTAPPGYAVTVFPMQLNISAGGAMDLDVNITANNATPGVLAYGALVLSSVNKTTLRIPMVLQALKYVIPVPVLDVKTRRSSGKYTVNITSDVQLVDGPMPPMPSSSPMPPCNMTSNMTNQTNGTTQTNGTNQTANMTCPNGTSSPMPLPMPPQVMPHMNVSVAGFKLAKMEVEVEEDETTTVPLMAHVPASAMLYFVQVDCPTAPHLSVRVLVHDRLVCERNAPAHTKSCMIHNPKSMGMGSNVTLFNKRSSKDDKPDKVTIYYGYVGPDTMQPLDVNIQAELTYTGPGMLSLSLMWDDKEIDEGDIYMGMVRWNSNMSSQPFVLQRLEDDVEFKQDPELPTRGGKVKFSIHIRPSVDGEMPIYRVLQTLPPQVTVVNGTLTASSGSAALLSSNTIVWNGTSSTSTNYRMTTSNEDRTCCNECNDVLKADDDTVVRPWATTTGTSAWDLWLPTTRPFFDGAYSNLFITDRGFLSFQQPPLGLQNLPPTTSLTELYLGPRPAGLLTWKKLTNIGCQNWQVAIVSAGSQDNATCRAECLANPNCARYSVGASCWQWGAGCIEHVDATFDSYVKEGHCPPGYALDSYGTFSCTAPGCATNNATATTVELCGAACNAASDCMAFNGGGGTCTLFSSVSGSAAGESYTVACLKAPPTLVAPFWANLNVSREGTEMGIAAGYSTEGGTVYSQVHYREVRNMEYDMPLLDVLTNYRSDQSTESGTMDIQFYYDHLKPWVPLPANSAFNNATNLLNAGTEKAVNAVNFTKAVGIVDTLSGTVVRELAGEIKDGTTVCFDRYAEDTVIEFEAMIDVGPMHVDVDPVTVLWHTSSAPGATQASKTMQVYAQPAYQRKGILSPRKLATPQWIELLPNSTLVNTKVPIKPYGFLVRSLSGLRFKLAAYSDVCNGTAPGSPDDGDDIDDGVVELGPVSVPGFYQICVKYDADWELTNTVMRILVEDGCILDLVYLVEPQPFSLLTPSWTLMNHNETWTGYSGDAFMTVPSGIYSLKANVAGTVTLNLDGLPHIAEASVSSTSPVQFVCKAKTLDLYAGAGSCEDYLSTKPGMCGCWYRQNVNNQTAAPTFWMPKDIPWRMVVGPKDAPKLVVQGCCAENYRGPSYFMTKNNAEWGMCDNRAMQ